MLRHWPYLPTHRGGMDDIVMWYYMVNMEMHCVDVTMGIDTLILFIGNCLLQYENYVVMKMQNDDGCIILNINIG
jgi:hypothetical protein